MDRLTLRLGNADIYRYQLERPQFPQQLLFNECECAEVCLVAPVSRFSNWKPYEEECGTCHHMNSWRIYWLKARNVGIHQV